MRTVIAIACLLGGLTAGSVPAFAQSWSAPRPLSGPVEQAGVAGDGRAVLLAGDVLTAVAGNAEPGETARIAADGPLRLAVSATGRVAVLARLDADTLGVGIGTTRSLPTELQPFADAADGHAIDDDYRVAIGADGRLLVAYASSGASGTRIAAVRRAPGEIPPRETVLGSYDSATGGYPSSFAVAAVKIDNSGRSAVAYEMSTPTGPSSAVRRSQTPDGEFARAHAGIAAGRYTRDPLTVLEGTGATSVFALGVNTVGGPDAVFTRRNEPDGTQGTDVTIARLTAPNRWTVDVGANGSAAIVWTGQDKLRVRTRSERGVWDEKPQTLASTVGAKKRRPAVAVSKLGRKLLAYPLGGRVKYASGRPGQPFGRLKAIPGSRNCTDVALAGAPSGRVLAVLTCAAGTRLVAARAA